MKKLILMIAATAILCGGIISCTTTGNSVKPLEEMTDLEYSKWQLYIQLGVKIGANRLLQEHSVTSEQLLICATVVEGLKDKPIIAGVKSLIIPALNDAGFNNDEIELVLLVAEQELLARGALNWINPETNTLELSPRTKEMLGIIAGSLRTAGNITVNEAAQASEMKANFYHE